MINHLINRIKQDKFKHKVINCYKFHDLKDTGEVKNANGYYENVDEIFCKINSPKRFVSFYINYRYHDWLPGYQIHIHVFTCPSDPYENKLIYKGWVQMPKLD